jgi:hypothetical protein
MTIGPQVTFFRALATAALAYADALEAEPAKPADELLDRAAYERIYPGGWRRVTDAGRRGELAIEHIGRKPVVRRSEVERWIAASRPAPAVPSDERADARASVVNAAARFARGRSGR